MPALLARITDFELVGSGLGLAVLGLGVFLWRQGAPTVGWLLPKLLALVGALVLVGVWIDPARAGAGFVAVWGLVLCLVLVVLGLAIGQLFRIRRAELGGRLTLVRQEREALFAQIRRRLRRAPPGRNGHPGSTPHPPDEPSS